MNMLRQLSRAWQMALISAVLVSLTPGLVRSQDPTDAPSEPTVGVKPASENPTGEEPAAENPAGETQTPPAEAPPELQDRWEYFVPVPLPAAQDERSPTLVDVILNKEVFAHARFDLADLRLYDKAGKTIPYALRYRRPQLIQERVPATEFNRAEPEGGPSELTLDLQRDDIQYNEIKIVTNGQDFRRAVEVAGSDDGKTWRTLVAANLIRFTHEKQQIDLDTLTFPGSRFRYVRVRVSPDLNRFTDERQRDQVTTTEVHVLRHVEDPGERLTQDATWKPRDPVRTLGVPGSAWIIDLGGDNVPCDRIEVDVDDVEFARDFQIEAEYPSGPLGQLRFSYIGMVSETLWQRKPGEPKKPLVANFQEVQTRRLKLSVADHQNPPLSIRAIRFSAPARQVVFARPAEANGEARLYFGNPEAQLPVYDFARNLPEKLAPLPVRAESGPAAQNPNFVPPPQPFTERFPWLIYVVLGSVSLVLAGLILSLARTTIRNHDAQVAVQ